MYIVCVYENYMSVDCNKIIVISSKQIHVMRQL